MAIERIMVYANTEEERLENILGVLEEHAVPKYFDSVEIVADTTKDVDYISCVKNDIEILKIYDSLNSYGFTVTTASDSYELKQYYNTNTGALWVCENGISFAIYGGALDRFTFTIALDENGNTAFLFSEGFSQPTGGGADIACLSTDVDYNLAYCKKGMPQATSHGYLTALCPIPVYQTEHYLQNVYLMPFCSNVGSEIIDIDGVKYISNGLWCVKD